MIIAQLTAITYWAGRIMGRRTVRKLAGDKVNRVSERLGENGIFPTSVIRLMPIAPYSIVNIVAGTPISVSVILCSAPFSACCRELLRLPG